LIEIHDIQSEEQKDLIWELTIPSLDNVNDKYNIGNIYCQYHNVITNTQEYEEISCTIKRGDKKSVIGERNVDLDAQYNRIIAANAMLNANKYAKLQKLNEAKLIIDNAIKKINNSNSNNNNDDDNNNNNNNNNLISDLYKCNEGLKDNNAYMGWGSKALNMNSNSHYQQRAVHASSWGAQQQYANNNQNNMMNNFNNNNNNNNNNNDWNKYVPSPFSSLNKNDIKMNKSSLPFPNLLISKQEKEEDMKLEPINIINPRFEDEYTLSDDDDDDDNVDVTLNINDAKNMKINIESPIVNNDGNKDHNNNDNNNKA
jgi:hypothetical protein